MWNLPKKQYILLTKSTKIDDNGLSFFYQNMEARDGAYTIIHCSNDAQYYLKACDAYLRHLENLAS